MAGKQNICHCRLAGFLTLLSVLTFSLHKRFTVALTTSCMFGVFTATSLLNMLQGRAHTCSAEQ